MMLCKLGLERKLKSCSSLLTAKLPVICLQIPVQQILSLKMSSDQRSVLSQTFNFPDLSCQVDHTSWATPATVVLVATVFRTNDYKMNIGGHLTWPSDRLCPREPHRKSPKVSLQKSNKTLNPEQHAASDPSLSLKGRRRQADLDQLDTARSQHPMRFEQVMTSRKHALIGRAKRRSRLLSVWDSEDS